MARLFPGALSVAILVVLVSSCDARDPSTRTVTRPVPPASPAEPPDRLAPRYDANLADGIDFSRPGYPTFISDVYGMSIREEWGRWTDGDVVVFRFAAPLPMRFAFEVAGGAYAENIGRPVKVRVGSVEKEIIFKGGPFNDTSVNVVEFNNETKSDTLVLLIPMARTASGDDSRRLGLALRSLRIIEKEP